MQRWHNNNNEKRECNRVGKSQNACYEYQCHSDSGEFTVNKRENATEWESKSNACYEYQCHNESGGISRKRENATEWESKSNACYEHQCHNDSGPISWKDCNRLDVYDHDRFNVIFSSNSLT